MMSKKLSGLLEQARRWPGVLTVSYAARELIFPQGGFATGAHLVSRGLVGLFRDTGSLRACLRVLGPGEFLGVEGWLGEERPQYRTAARALTEVELLFFPPCVWERAWANREFQSLVLASVAQTWTDFLEQELRRGDAKNALLWAFQRWGQESTEGLKLALGTHLLASVLGLSRPALKQAFADLDVAQDGEFLVLQGERGARVPALTGSPR